MISFFYVRIFVLKIFRYKISSSFLNLMLKSNHNEEDTTWDNVAQWQWDHKRNPQSIGQDKHERRVWRGRREHNGLTGSSIKLVPKERHFLVLCCVSDCERGPGRRSTQLWQGLWQRRWHFDIKLHSTGNKTPNWVLNCYPINSFFKI